MQHTKKELRIENVFCASGWQVRFIGVSLSSNTQFSIVLDPPTSLKRGLKFQFPKSDITLFREYRSEFDPKQRFKGDKAYQGEDLITTPIKKPRNRDLTSEQKAENAVLGFTPRGAIFQDRTKQSVFSQTNIC